MNKEAWLKFIPRSKEAHHLREIFNGTYGLIDLLPVQKMFFDRIDYLLTLQVGEHTRSALINLREDIEDEIETGKMRERGERLPKTKSRPYDLTEKERIVKMIDTLESNLEKLREMIEVNK